MLGSAPPVADGVGQRSGYRQLVELIVGALVVLGFLAILTRFIARDPSGEIVLPRVIDDSIGMWVLRRVTRRRLWERPLEDEAPPTSEFDVDTSDATRAALGAISAANAANAATPAMGSGSIALPRSVSVTRRAAVFPVSKTPVADLRRRQRATRPQHARPHRSFGLPRAAAYALAVAVVVVGGVALGAFIGRSQGGQVLATTAQPTESQVAAAAPAETSSPSPGHFEPFVAPSISAIPSATPLPAATPPSTPRATPHPTPRPTPGPTPIPTPRPTPKPTPHPTPSPTPPPPPVASITCTLVVLEISCDGSGSARAVNFRFVFGDGFVADSADPTVSHLYASLDDASKSVSLTVTDSLGSTNTDTWP